MGPAAQDELLVHQAEAAARRRDERPLSNGEIETFREHLQQMREWLIQGLANLENQLAQQTGGAGDDLDQACQSAISQRAIADRRLLLNEVMGAFERMNANTYGRCVRDDRAIPRALLEQTPWARFCEQCATHQALS